MRMNRRAIEPAHRMSNLRSLRALLIGACMAVVALVASPAALAAAPSWSVTSVANSATTTPATSFTQGDGTTGFPGTGPDTYTLTVTNNGSAGSPGGVTVTAALGSGLTFVSRTANNWTCSGTTTTTCTRTDPLAAGQSYPDKIVITASVSTTAGANTEGGGLPAHVNLNLGASGGGASSPSAQTITTAIVGRPNLTSVESPNTTFRQSDAADSYTINVINQGVGATSSGTANPPATPIVATETIPTGETAVALSGSGWTCSLAATTAGVNAAVYTEPANTCWRTDSWPGYASLPLITLVVSVAGNAAATQSLATVVTGGGSVTASNSVSYSTTVQQAADLTETVAHTGNFNQGDPGDTYTLTTRNIVGPNSTVGGPTVGPVVVTDTAPAGETITRMAGTGWVCTLAPVQITGTPNVVVPSDSCYRSDPLTVATGSYPPITVTVAVANDAQSPAVNTATVSGGGITAASTAGGGQTATDSTTITPEPDLTVAASTSGPFTQGDGAGANDSFSITVINAGFAATSGQVNVRDDLPLDFAPLAASGSGWTCTVSGQTVACNRSDALGTPGSYAPITIRVSIAPDAGYVLDNRIQVWGGGEINLSNDYAAQQTYVAPVGDLTISLTHPGDFHQNDPADVYTIVVSNATLAPTTNAPVAVTVTIPPDSPPDLYQLSLAGSGWSCSVATLTCTRNDPLPPAGFYPPILLTAHVSWVAPPVITPTATVSGGGEIYTANDTSSNPTNVIFTPHQVSVPVNPVATVSSQLGLSVPGSASFGTFVAGVAADYTTTLNGNVITTAQTSTVSITDHQRGRHRPPGQRDLLTGVAAAGGRHEPGGQRLRLPAAQLDCGPATGAAELPRSGQQRPDRDLAQAAHRRDRPAAHGYVQQDADRHAVDQHPVGTLSRPLRRPALVRGSRAS